MILRCQLPHRTDRSRLCGGMIGAAPDEATVVGLLSRLEDARPECFALRCFECKRIVEICPPWIDRAA